MSLDKQALKDELLRLLEEERDTLIAAQKATADGVTHEDNRAESDKDMRATEASYLARGQAQRVEALSADVERVRALKLRDLRDDDPIGVGAVIEVKASDGRPRGLLFLAPAGGGITLATGADAVRVITPQSPLGRALVRARAGDVVEVDKSGRVEEIEVASVR